MIKTLKIMRYITFCFLASFVLGCVTYKTNVRNLTDIEFIELAKTSRYWGKMTKEDAAALIRSIYADIRDALGRGRWAVSVTPEKFWLLELPRIDGHRQRSVKMGLGGRLHAWSVSENV